MDYLDAYFAAAKATKSYWREFDQDGNHLVLATFLWGPQNHTRHILFLMNQRTKLPTRSFSYEPENTGDSIFLGEATNEGVRINHGKISAMTRDEFLSTALAKLTGSGVPKALQTTVASPLPGLPKGVQTLIDAGLLAVGNPSRELPKGTSTKISPGTCDVSTPTSSDPKPDSLPECDALLELAVPQLYRRNLFRVLNLPVTATSADVRRQQKRLEMQRKLGVAASDEGKNTLALVPPPTDEDIRSAMDRLNDPESRLLDEVFWFWPTGDNATDDAALCALQDGDVAQATDFWTNQAKENGRGQIATHNLAVLDHLAALDYESSLKSGSTDAKQNAHISELWSRALGRWRQVVDGEDFWSRVRERVLELKDVKLTTGLVRRLRSTFPKALLQINATLASKAAESGSLSVAKIHLGIIREAKFGEELAGEVLRESLKPIRNRIKVLCEPIGPQVDKNPEHANTIIWELLQQAKPLLDIADAVLSTDDPMLQGLHDDVASTALAGQIIYGNKTEKWDESIKLLDASLTIAIGRAVRERIERNLEIVRQNREVGRCHYCGNRASVENAAYQVAMHGDVQSTQYGRSINRTWNHTTVKVPRCKQCKLKMQIFRAISYPLAVGLIAGLVTLLCQEVPNAIEVFEIIGGCLALLVMANGVGIVLIVLLGFYSARFVEAALYRVFAVLLRGKWHPTKLHPAIKKLKGERWDFGKKPGSLGSMFPPC